MKLVCSFFPPTLNLDRWLELQQPFCSLEEKTKNIASVTRLLIQCQQLVGGSGPLWYIEKQIPWCLGHWSYTLFLATKCDPNGDALRYKYKDPLKNTQTTEGETAEENRHWGLTGRFEHHLLCSLCQLCVNMSKFNCASVSASKGIIEHILSITISWKQTIHREGFTTWQNNPQCMLFILSEFLPKSPENRNTD